VRQAYGDCTVVKQRKKLYMKLASDLLQARNWPVLPIQSTTALSTDPSSLTLAPALGTGASSIGSLPAKFNLNSLNDHQNLARAVLCAIDYRPN
jgi:hypothetical protein